MTGGAKPRPASEAKGPLSAALAQGAEESGTGSDLEEPWPALHGLSAVGPFAAIGLGDAAGRGRVPPECAPENFLGRAGAGDAWAGTSGFGHHGKLSRLRTTDQLAD